MWCVGGSFRNAVMTELNIKLCSMNCRGLAEFRKRRDVLHFLRGTNFNIILLQDIHCKIGRENMFRNSWGKDILIAPFSENARGVAILTNKVQVDFSDTIIDEENGRYIITKIVIEKVYKIWLVNLYAPNRDTPDFFVNINSLLEMCQEKEQLPVVIGGDFNLVLCQKEDTFNYARENNVRAKAEVVRLMEKQDLIDIFRSRHSAKKRFTWRIKNPVLKQARLDFFLTSSSLEGRILDTSIRPGYRTDHSMITLQLNVAEQPRGNGLFKLNVSLLREPDYIQRVKNTIVDTIKQYAIPLYTDTFLSENMKEIQFTISDSLFFEVLIMNIRAQTISYATYKKRRRQEIEIALAREINMLENELDAHPNFDLAGTLKVKQDQFEELRQNMIDGVLVRSRATWREYGEKSSKYFLSLEKRQYTSKIIPCLHTTEGVVFKHSDIMSNLHAHFTHLFQNHDAVEDHDALFEGLRLKTLSELEKAEIGRPIELQEISEALRTMKNGKTPGSDGFPAEFYKMFWSELKYFLLRVYKEVFANASLPVTMREGILILIPKGDKPRDQIGSYRPITLLNVCYKILAGALANRYKKVLPRVIDPAQTAFLRKRFIGDNVRVMFDIIHKLKEIKRHGLFISLDIESAFNSISWSFIREVLKRHLFPQNCIQWFDILYGQSFSRILYNGHLSEKIKLERSCRQGDQLSCYLFLLAMECLAHKIRDNDNIKGIKINGEEYKISLYADDALCLLDGDINSVRVLFHELGVFAKFSGLRPNIDKTQAMWIGEIENTENICPDLPLKWVTEMNVLGIKFQNDLDEMCRCNYYDKLTNIKKTILAWNLRNLTLDGKITVIKFLLLSKLTHLFTSLPAPPKEFLQELNTLLFRFIWNGKKDRIKRKTLIKPFAKGGRAMIDLEIHIAALKLSWIRRQMTSLHKWTKLFDCFWRGTFLIWEMNAKSLRNIAERVGNPFWREVILALALFNDAYKITDGEIGACSVWYSDQIKFVRSGLRAWHTHGIRYLNDLLKSDNTLLNFNEFRVTFGLNTTYLDYMGLIESLPLQWRRAPRREEGPMIHPMVRYMIAERTGVRSIYTVMIEWKTRETRNVWECKWDCLFPHIDWDQVYYDMSHTSTFSAYKVLNYKIISGIYVTNTLLHKIGIKDSDMCEKCLLRRETVVHKFWECRRVKEFWEEIQGYLRMVSVIDRDLTINGRNVFFETNVSSVAKHAINIGKYMISRGWNLRTEIFIKKLKSDIKVEHVASLMAGTERRFHRKWGNVRLLLNEEVTAR